MKKLKCYNVSMDSELYAISLVDDPAIEELFITLSKDKPKEIYLENNEKQIVIGAALIPDKPIYRNMDGEEFYIQFNKETIEKMAYNFLKNYHNHDITLEHNQNVEDVYVVESWIKTNENDKSVALGLNKDLPIGTWIIALKVENKELWQDIKEGKAKGFSIESICGLDEIKLNNYNNMKYNNVKMEAVEIDDKFWDKLRSIIANAVGKPQESKEVEETVGEVVDAMEDSAEDSSKESKVKVIENETISPKIDETIKDIVDDINEDANTVEEAKEDLEAVIDGLREEIEKKDAEIEQLKKQNQKLMKHPSTKPVKVEASKNTNPRDVLEALRNGTYFKK